jgi:oligopeptide transport system ATP-binding protein
MEPIFRLENLKAYFRTRRGLLKAVDDVSFDIRPGETVAMVGESGSGKSVCQLAWLGLLPKPPLEIHGGKALFKNEDLLSVAPERLRQVRGNRVTVIFQEPMTSLNPYLRVGTQVMEPLLIHTKISKKDAHREAIKALERVGISEAESALRAYPHEFSGGMRQRVMIAMALCTKPDLLIADEPTTALDVTVQAQILKLLKDLQKETGMGILFITHDLGVVAQIADRVVVLYAGKVMEKAPVDPLFYEMKHPYTRALLQATPRLDLDIAKLPSIAGGLPDLTQALPGCPFEPRCAHRIDRCTQAFPPADQSSNHTWHCFAPLTQSGETP